MQDMVQTAEAGPAHDIVMLNMSKILPWQILHRCVWCCAGVGAGKRKGGKSRLANMWSKAPAVKEKPQQAAKSKNQAALAVDADAAVRSAQQVRFLIHKPSCHMRHNITRFAEAVMCR